MFLYASGCNCLVGMGLWIRQHDKCGGHANRNFGSLCLMWHESFSLNLTVAGCGGCRLYNKRQINTLLTLETVIEQIAFCIGGGD